LAEIQPTFQAQPLVPVSTFCPLDSLPFPSLLLSLTYSEKAHSRASHLHETARDKVPYGLCVLGLDAEANLGKGAAADPQLVCRKGCSSILSRV